MKKRLFLLLFLFPLMEGFCQTKGAPSIRATNKFTKETVEAQCVTIIDREGAFSGKHYKHYTYDVSFEKNIFSIEILYIEIAEVKYHPICAWGVSINGGAEEIMEVSGHYDEEGINMRRNLSYRIPLNLPKETCEISVIIHLADEIHNEKCSAYEFAGDVYTINFKAVNGKRIDFIDGGDEWIIAPPIIGKPSGSTIKASLYNQYGDLKTTTSSNTGSLRISKTGLQRGLYILKGEYEGVPFTEKLTVVR